MPSWEPQSHGMQACRLMFAVPASACRQVGKVSEGGAWRRLFAAGVLPGQHISPLPPQRFQVSGCRQALGGAFTAAGYV